MPAFTFKLRPAQLANWATGGGGRGLRQHSGKQGSYTEPLHQCCLVFSGPGREGQGHAVDVSLLPSLGCTPLQRGEAGRLTDWVLGTFAGEK